jgi:hypothetical protein
MCFQFPRNSISNVQKFVNDRIVNFLLVQGCSNRLERTDFLKKDSKHNFVINVLIVIEETYKVN